MITVYLNLPGRAAEAARFYADAFGAPEPELLFARDMPPEEKARMAPDQDDMVIHAEINAFAGRLWLSDSWPGAPCAAPTEAVHITVSHRDQEKLREAFGRLKEGGEVTMPLAPAFFSPLHGQLRDKYGFYWLFVAKE